MRISGLSVTKFEGVLTPYSKLSADEQNNAKGKIKYQVNKLYKATFRQLYKGGVNDVRDMFAILDAVIEIPDYEDIWRVKAKSGEENYVLINWGFTSDDFNAHNNRDVLGTDSENDVAKVMAEVVEAIETGFRPVINTEVLDQAIDKLSRPSGR